MVKGLTLFEKVCDDLTAAVVRAKQVCRAPSTTKNNHPGRPKGSKDSFADEDESENPNGIKRHDHNQVKNHEFTHNKCKKRIKKTDQRVRLSHQQKIEAVQHFIKFPALKHRELNEWIQMKFGCKALSSGMVSNLLKQKDVLMREATLETSCIAVPREQEPKIHTLPVHPGSSECSSMACSDLDQIACTLLDHSLSHEAAACFESEITAFDMQRFADSPAELVTDPPCWELLIPC